MKIYELPDGTNVEFTLEIDGRKMQFPSTIVVKDEKHKRIYASAIVVNDKVISIGSTKSRLDMIATFKEDKPIVFADIVANAVRVGGERVYSLECEYEGQSINRRGSYRCYVGTRSEVTSGIGKDPIPAVLKDISISGFAFVLDQEELEVGQLVYCILEDSIELTEESFQFNLFGIIVRKQVLDSGKIVYGCKLNRQIAGIDSYIAKKDREALARHRE